MKFVQRRRKLITRGKVFLPTKKRITIPLKKIFFILIILTSLAAGYLVFRSDLFLVKNLEIPSLSCADKTAIQSKIDVLNTSFFMVKENEIEDRLKKNFLCLSETKIKKIWPDRVILEIRERQALAAISSPPQTSSASASSSAMLSTSSNQQPFFLVDENGVVFSQVATTSGVPVLIMPQNITYKPGDNIDQARLKNVVTILSNLREMSYIVNNVSFLSDGNIQILLASEQKILIGVDKNPQNLLNSLQLIVRQAKIEGKTWQKIDLRFDKPVVVYGT